MTEKDEAWVDIAWGDIDWDKTGIARGDVEWIDGGKRFLWASERDGWRHIYSISRDGSDVKTITPGNYDVISVERVDTQNGFSISSRHRKTQRNVISIACASTARARKND
jgi:dipeptidyl-peptidase-4